MTKPKIFIFPGNGDCHMDIDNWYPWLRNELRHRGFEVFAEDMPDAHLARAVVWLPYMVQVIGGDTNVILIGHSSGAVAIMRYLEDHKALGAIIVGAKYTDLGFVEEKLAGYYTDPWQWAKIKANVGWISQFCSTDDPYISVQESRYIHDRLATDYHELTGRGHFEVSFNPVNNTFPEIIGIIEARVK
jgi:hypothetical protein